MEFLVAIALLYFGYSFMKKYIPNFVKRGVRQLFKKLFG